MAADLSLDTFYKAYDLLKNKSKEDDWGISINKVWDYSQSPQFLIGQPIDFNGVKFRVCEFLADKNAYRIKSDGGDVLVISAKMYEEMIKPRMDFICSAPIVRNVDGDIIDHVDLESEQDQPCFVWDGNEMKEVEEE